MFSPLVYLTVLLVAACGLVYEFLAGVLSSYMLGGGVTQFSLVIGVFLSALGLGAYISRFVQERVAYHFLHVELALALIGGFAPLVLFASFVHPMSFLAALYAVTALQATLVGVEMPLIVRMLRRRVEFKKLVARAFGFDYLGSLVASVLFALVLLPRLGLVRTGIAFGLVNAGVALGGTWLFASDLSHHRALRLHAIGVMAVLVGGFFYAERLTRVAESLLYVDPIIYAKQTKFQRIVITSNRRGFNLYLDGNLQFASNDEYRYHEALVHPIFAATNKHARVLVLGGGDGLAAREILRHKDVQSVHLVDIDSQMTSLGKSFPPFVTLNQRSFHDPKVTIINQDAMSWLKKQSKPFNVVIIDFPDPNNYTLGKLYTTGFYRLVLQHLADDGALVVQSTSPLMARNSYWCVVHTLDAVGLHTYPYHAFVPSFGEWGFVMASRRSLTVGNALPRGLRYLTPEIMKQLFTLSPDMGPVPVKPNRLNSQVLVRYYDEEWRRIL